MTISYKWLSEYLPVTLEPERLSRILTAIGLEVERLEAYEEIKGGLKGLVIGEVLNTEKHPNADKLTLTRVNIGNGQPLQIVCGAPNVAAGQKVLVAPVGTTIYPTSGEPVTMKLAKIRSIESQGMICAEDEVGLGNSHTGILVLPAQAKPGTPAADYFKPYIDWIFEIGLTPNHMDAMSHWGVARDVCAYLSHHDQQEIKPRLPIEDDLKIDNTSLAIDVKVENINACPRYSGVSIANIIIGPSPAWLQQRLRAIGQRPINNIVDVTNYVQHETGQPLHAFDASALAGNKIIVKNLPQDTPFITLDEKLRKLDTEDLMICDANEGICIAGVFGGLHSGVTPSTRHIFLEGACFDPVSIRKTSSRHGLKTDAAARFEKGTDISATITVLKRAASLIKETCGGQIASEIVDVYPAPREKIQVSIKYQYLKKISGKMYQPAAVKSIMTSLGFEIISDDHDELQVAAPYHKPDIRLPADLAEEILRIDGLDNIDIPEAITVTPSVEENYAAETYREKTAYYLTGLGFHEIITNSITQAAYFSASEQEQMIKMINSLSADLNIMRNSLLETALECVAHNLNRKNLSLKFFEFGRAYTKMATGKYQEEDQLCVLITGHKNEASWKEKSSAADFFHLKGVVDSVFTLAGLKAESVESLVQPKFDNHVVFKINGQIVAGAGEVDENVLAKFDIKQPVFYAGFNWALLSGLASKVKIVVRDLPRFPAVQRDVAMIVPKQLLYEEVEKTVQKIGLDKLQDMKLFDIFESEKIGNDKKSIAVNFTFLDEEKTLTDKEIDGWMNKIMDRFEKDLQAEIRR